MNPTLQCRDDQERRRLARAKPLNGFDFLEVSDDQRHLTVFFLEKAPEWITARHLRIEGGRRIRDIRVLEIKINRSEDPERDDCMVVTLDKPGDFSTYTLCVVAIDEAGRASGGVPDDFDPRYSCLCFSFKAGCPSELDCALPVVCPTQPREEPEIDYLAKDYASFRRLILDRLAMIMPDWQERHVPDIGITLVELLAYTGDHLSYYQDAVASEAYLNTARQRISVRRHARLVDYLLHEGCNARAWVQLDVSQSLLRLQRGDFYFITAIDGLSSRMLKEAQLPSVQPLPYLVFEPMLPAEQSEVELRADHNEIRLYTWSETLCCLPKGATSATLVDPGSATLPPESPSHECNDEETEEVDAPAGDNGPQPEDYRLCLKPCDLLLFEEVKGAHTGNPADADPAHRHLVRLTQVTPSWDPLTGQLLQEVCWAQEDALPFPLCISATGPAPECKLIPDISVARGNLLLVDHGQSVNDDLGQVPYGSLITACGDGCLPPGMRHEPAGYGPILQRPNLTYAAPLPPCVQGSSVCEGSDPISPALSLTQQDPRAALPWIALLSIPAAPNGEPAFTPDDLLDPTELAAAIAAAGPEPKLPAAWLAGQLAPSVLAGLADWIDQQPPPPLPVALAGEIEQLLHSLVQSWEARRDLLASANNDCHFVVEIDDERSAHIRFGDGDCGRRPDAGEAFHADYRIGNGSVGNVGAETIAHIVFSNAFPDGVDLRPRNPLPAFGGLASEEVAEAKLRAPYLFHRRLERAITADDYAAIVMRDFAARVQRAAAVICWTGIGPQVQVAVDALGQAEPEPVLLCEIEEHLQRYRRIGHDLLVTAAQMVPLDLRLRICVREGYLRGHVRQALLECFSNRLLPGGVLGFFHPDNLSFGQGVYLSHIVSAAQAVQGVQSVQVYRLERLYAGDNNELASGVLPLGPLEVARLDNDPGFPEHGQLTIKLEGGR